MSKPRKALLARVHIAKKELALTDEAYGDVLTRVTGESSARTLSDVQLRRLLDEFKRLGWKPMAGPRSQKPQVRLIYVLWKELKPHLRDSSREALQAFVRRHTISKVHPRGIDAPEFLDSRNANLVIEGLKAWSTRLRIERRAAEQAQIEAAGGTA